MKHCNVKLPRDIRKHVVLLPSFSLLLALAVSASMVTADGQQSTSAPAIPVTGFPGLDQYRASRVAVFTNDFGQLARYRDANAALEAPTREEDRVIFFGDSITDKWEIAESFPGKKYLNRGIGGQTTPQMIVRFRQDVIDLHPRVVIILAGTNDIAGNTGPMRLEDVEANYASMAELAGAHNIKVIYSSVLPVNNYTPRSQEFFAERSPEKILALNRWLRNYCEPSSVRDPAPCSYLDYFSALADKRGYLKKELSDDGLHPNAAGYKIMAPMAQSAIEQALGPTKR
jgi:acyl-CoA thioesterase I